MRGRLHGTVQLRKKGFVGQATKPPRLQHRGGPHDRALGERERGGGEKVRMREEGDRGGL
jgi:hypothetical protein